ncbi:MAG: tRNA (adenosine(37)-N6)-threonylcarbamoyltransferase complex ATPase subunit type 1 TsaE [Alphaproteobacteria bacterium]|nr:tRNA (adenosine(37)-N6)-threonylcarbamoyltransferase complex ATPase subunit type 1 TsaE [Alphaproteobacteria bacterium]
MKHPVPTASGEPRSVAIQLADLAATERLARRLAGVSRRGDLIALVGDLGSGKTTFARFFLRAISGRADEETPSPTFNLVLVYAYPHVIVWHFDLYRLQTPEEAYELGIDDALAEGIAIIEWPERLGRYLPEDRLELRLEEGPDPTARRATLVAGPSWCERLPALLGAGA